MADLVDERPVSRKIFNPCNSLLKQGRSARAECQTVYCRLADCPLRRSGACMLLPLFNWTNCPYGRLVTEVGPTRRSSKFGTWIRERQRTFPDVPSLGYPVNKMAFVGDYVYLPYFHMVDNEHAPFLRAGSLFTNGVCLIPREHWTLKTLLLLLSYRPQALMGGEIIAYQSEQLPLFLRHLRECDPAMWQALIAIRPGLDVAPDHVGRKALLRTLRPLITWSTRHKDYPVNWIWDGVRVSTHDLHAYSSVWGEIELQGLNLSGTPDADATLVVQDNDWVTEETVFVD